MNIGANYIIKFERKGNDFPDIVKLEHKNIYQVNKAFVSLCSVMAAGYYETATLYLISSDEHLQMINRAVLHQRQGGGNAFENIY